MNINITSHNIEITDSITEHINSKFKKLNSLHPLISNIKTIIRQDGKEFKTEISVSSNNATISAHSSTDDLYQAITKAINKIKSELQTQKNHLKKSRGDKVDTNDETIAHEKVQEMTLN